MIIEFADICTSVYGLADDIWKQILPLFKRPGLQPQCSASELIAMALIGECRGWQMETELLSRWNEDRHLFPNIPSQSRCNRRCRNVMQATNLIRQIIIRSMDLCQDRRCLIDRLPMPVVQFHLVPSSRGDWRANEATFGKAITKKRTIFGDRLHLLVCMSGLILDFELTPANCSDLDAGYELLNEHVDLEVLGDKAYISAAKAALLWKENRVMLRTSPRSNQKQQVSAYDQHLRSSVRQLIETVNRQRSGQFGIEKNFAHAFWGVCTRLYSKLTAHTLCIFIN